MICKRAWGMRVLLVQETRHGTIACCPVADEPASSSLSSELALTYSCLSDFGSLNESDQYHRLYATLSFTVLMLLLARWENRGARLSIDNFYGFCPNRLLRIRSGTCWGGQNRPSCDMAQFTMKTVVGHPCLG
jgi:hypothetical protein